MMSDMHKCRIESDVRFLLQQPTVSADDKKVLLEIQKKMKTINQGKEND
jgi:hypothetical protein